MWPYSWTHVGTPSHLGHMDRVAATMPSQAHAGAAQEAPNIGQWEGQDVPLVRPSSCTVKGGIPSSRRYLPTYRHIPPQQRPAPAERPEDALPGARGPISEPGAGYVPGRSVRTGCGTPPATSTGRGLGSGRTHGICERRGRDAHPPPSNQPGVQRHQADPPVRGRVRDVPQGAHLVSRLLTTQLNSSTG